MTSASPSAVEAKWRAASLAASGKHCGPGEDRTAPAPGPACQGMLPEPGPPWVITLEVDYAMSAMWQTA